MIDGTLRIEGTDPFGFCGWFIRITDVFGNDWFGAGFPTHSEATKWASSNLGGHQWSVILLAGQLRRMSGDTEDTVRANPDLLAKIAGRVVPLRTARDARHDPR